MKKISFLVSKECFMNCRGCYLDDRSGSQMTAADIISYAGKLKNDGYQGITLSGGDPLKRKDISIIIQGLKKLGFEVNLDTVGLPLLDKSFADNHFPFSEMASSINLIGIPYDGSNEAIRRMFRTSSFETGPMIEAVLRILNDNNFKVSINTVVHRGNIGDLNAIYKRIIEYRNVIRWELHQFVVLSKKSAVVKDELEISEAEFIEAFETINNYKEITISPKPSNRKSNFQYIDFDGSLIQVRDGIVSKKGSILTKELPAQVI